MDDKQLAAEVRQALEEIKAHGFRFLEVDNLIAYFSRIEQSAKSGPADLTGAADALEADSRKMAHEAALENFRTVIAAGQNAIRTMLIINGGASVAILAFLGQIYAEDGADLAIFAWCLVLFAAGTFAAGLVSALTYLGQMLYSRPRGWYLNVGIALHILTILLGLASFGFFAAGAWEAYSVFSIVSSRP